MTRTRAAIRAELVEARGRVHELEAELAMAAPERCRLAGLGPCDGDSAVYGDGSDALLEVVVGLGRNHRPVRTVTTSCELHAELTGFLCPEPCPHHCDLRSMPLTVIKLVPDERAPA